MAELAAKSPELEATNIEESVAEKAIQKGKKYYMDNLYGKTVFSPALNEEIKFTSRGLLYLRRKGTIEEQARRFKLLPKVFPIVENIKTIDPQDIRQIEPNHYRYSLLGRFKDGSVVKVVFDEVQMEGKKFYSVFDIEDLRGDKLYKKLGQTTSGELPSIPSDVTTPDKSITEASKTIPPTEKDVKGEGGETSADVGGYAENRSIIEMPEIVEIARELSEGRYPVIRKRLRAAGGEALGVFWAKGKKEGKIGLRADLFKDTGTASKVLAHEVGHLVDWLPDETLKRGNILGHVASLKRYMKSMLEEFPDSAEGVISARERNSIRNEVTKDILSEQGKRFKDFMEDAALRDSQKMVNSSARLIVDNKALSGNGMVGVNIDRINTKRTRDFKVYPGKTWYVKGNFSPKEAVDAVTFPDITHGLKELMEMFERFADEETGIPKYTHGEQGSFLNKTATGMSMLMTHANLNLKTVMKNIDDFWIEPIVEAFYAWMSEMGDMQTIPLRIKATGSDSLIAKEIKLENYMKFMQISANPQDAIFMDRVKLMKNISRLLETEDIMRPDEEIKGIMEEMTRQAMGVKNLRETIAIDRLYPLLTRQEQMQVLQELGVQPDAQPQPIANPKEQLELAAMERKIEMEGVKLQTEIELQNKKLEVEREKVFQEIALKREELDAKAQSRAPRGRVD